MRVNRVPLSLVAAVLCVGLAHAQEASPRVLSPQAMEAFLLNAELSDVRGAGVGVTGSLRATASDRQLTHDVHIQTVDDYPVRHHRRRPGGTGAFPISRSRAHTHRRHGHPLQTVPSAGLIERPQEKNRVDALR